LGQSNHNPNRCLGTPFLTHRTISLLFPSNDLERFVIQLSERVGFNLKQKFKLMIKWIVVEQVSEFPLLLGFEIFCKPLQSKFTLLKSNFFSRQNSLFQNTKEKIGGKKITLQRNEVPA
jgi:hypothetical protein